MMVYTQDARAIGEMPSPSQSSMVGGGEMDVSKMLVALKPLERVFLEHSYDVLSKPVDQMFPNVEV